ncbi:MAG: outer membrane lipoprotein carrier protein LolA [Ignavibacteriaceae bacterium]|jgi:outer membrane lipoprotein carrier protein|nr:outer membrane lipoprotein carrier protein LolA [Chlorobium sp.]MCW8817317.1 outer membrane lipoprotein carrier protein LolA [Ignavibacteriaceae bacterium]MCW8824094.1 outer membrane lipoprotein carrier protein LolA [Ignavibacteriaceae bacterium]
MFVRNIFVLIITFVFCNSIIAQDDAKALLKNIQDNFDSIDDLSAEITQLINGKINLEGKVYYKKENHLRFEFNNMLIVSDGETSWNYNKKQNKVIITDYDTEGNKILSLRQIIYEYPDECELSTYDSEGEKVLQLIPKNNSLSFNSVKLFITDDNLISKVLIDDPPTGSIQVFLSNYKINKNLSDSLFSFSPPEGSQVLDLR